MYVSGGNQEFQTPFEIVGVADHVKRQDYSDDERPLFYSFDRQFDGGIQTYFVVRGTADVASLLPTLRRAVTDVTPQIIVIATTLMEERVSRSVAEERFRAMPLCSVRCGTGTEADARSSGPTAAAPRRRCSSSTTTLRSR